MVTNGCQAEQFAHAVFPTTYAELVEVTGSAWSRRCQTEQLAHAVFPTTFAELVAVTGGESADVA